MTNLAALSNEIAETVAAGAASVVQVIGARRPASGIVHGPDTIITMARAIGREDGLRIRLPGQTDDTVLNADLAGWDPATGIAVLRAGQTLDVPPPAIAESEPRAGDFVVAIARSWSNAITASEGIVAVVGGPLRTGRRRQIARVLRITASMHEGFAGGAVFDASRRLTGIATSSVIRGFGLVIPASIAWTAAAQVLSGGTARRGFVGIGVQPVDLPASQQPDGRERALLVVGVTPSGPAEAAGIIIGDVLLQVDGQPTQTPDDLLDLLTERRVGQKIVLRTLRGGIPREAEIVIGSRG